MFAVLPTYTIPPAAEQQLLTQITAEVSQALDLPITRWRPMGGGQNPTYQLFADRETEPRYLLKIPKRKGYPAVATLRVCYGLLRDAGVGDYQLVYANESDSVVPYGFFVQPWLAGEAFDAEIDYAHDFAWLDDFLPTVRRVHQIALPAFGYLANGPQYATLYEYFAHMDAVIDHSFGQVFAAPTSIWDLETRGVTTPGFLATTFEQVRTLAAQIATPVQPVLLHGDMLPSNLLRTADGLRLIDWDESRAGWWLYELARTLYYCPYDALLDYCLERYDVGATSRQEIDIGIRLEHVRQSLRELWIGLFHETDHVTAQAKGRPYEAKIAALLQSKPHRLS
jgi:aminoglycoside phosphotransferase (APT) family kinase protein